MKIAKAIKCVWLKRYKENQYHRGDQYQQYRLNPKEGGDNIKGDNIKATFLLRLILIPGAFLLEYRTPSGLHKETSVCVQIFQWALNKIVSLILILKQVRMKYLVTNSAWVDPVNLEMSFATSLLYFRIIARIWFMNEFQLKRIQYTIHEWIDQSGLKN